MEYEEKREPKILEDCYRSAEHENVIWVCDVNFNHLNLKEKF